MKPRQVADLIPTISKNLSKTVEVQTKKKSISHLTNLCKKLQKKQKVEDEGGPVEEQATIEYRAPFAISTVPAYPPGLVFHNNAWKTANQIIAETNSYSQALVPLTDKFPVSAGLLHKDVRTEVPGANVFGQQVAMR